MPQIQKESKKYSHFEQFLSIALFFILVAGSAYSLNWVEKSVRQEVQASFSSTRQVTDILKSGYLGNYGPASLPKASQFSGNEKTVSQARDVRIINYFGNFQSKVVLTSSEALADPPAIWQAELVNQSYSKIEIDPLKKITFRVDFKNTGKTTWSKTGAHFVALNAASPAGRLSPFRDKNTWPAAYRPGRLLDKEVKPGQIGHFKFVLAAPKTPGTYLEKFSLVAENLTWIKGGNLEILIGVGQTAYLAPPYKAELVTQAYSKIDLDPGKKITFSADFRNVGTKIWLNSGKNFIAMNVTDPIGRTSSFKNASWRASYRPAKLLDKEVRPGQIGHFKFVLAAPTKPGEYLEKFGLVAENLTWITGGVLEIPINVIAPVVEPEPVQVIQGEPTIRVGLFSTTDPIQITANGSYEIRNNEGTVLTTESATAISTVTFSNNQYSLKTPLVELTTASYLRFVPVGEAILEVLSYEHRSGWQPEINDNKFRGVIEIRYAEATSKLWVIDELLLESYLRGIAELSNADPAEYQKTLMIAARTYAMYHSMTKTKHQAENYTVDAVNDQVYRGYNFELRSPDLTKMIIATAGQMVTYNNEVVVTPYFSHTDGRTRAWEEVWSGGPKEWLKSVPVPEDQDLSLLGHGVGLSGHGARLQAQAGKTHEEILKYFYTGIEIKKVY